MDSHSYHSSARDGADDTDSARARLIGKIVLARFLERSPAAVLAAVRAAEKIARMHGLFDGHAAAIRRRNLSGAVIEEGRDSRRFVAHIRIQRAKPVFIWRSKYFACEYFVDDARLAPCLARVGDGQAEASDDTKSRRDAGLPVRAGRACSRHRVGLLRAVRTLLLVTTRNRIAHEIARTLVVAQRDFLRTGDEVRLAPLTLNRIAEEARMRGVPAADTSRISRLLRSMVVLAPKARVWNTLVWHGAPRALRTLCPTSRAILRALVRDVLERERLLRARGSLRRTWTDDEIARRVANKHRDAGLPVRAGRTCSRHRRLSLSKHPGVCVSRRLVAYCRKSLGVPCASIRSRRGGYPAAMMGFSQLCRLESSIICARAPASPGIYELRIAEDDQAHEPSCVGIIYVGKAGNLRRRLLAHAGRNGRNGQLATYVRNARVLFRFRMETHDLKAAEKAMYRRFIETYGRRPECNRMSP